jgi:hypothetical protein
MEAFNDLMLREGQLRDILPALGALTTFGVLYWILGLKVLLRREVRSA